ncbi:hypothetical protein ACH475_32020 [Streptomyces globisporus]
MRQAVSGKGPDREVLRDPGGTYVMRHQQFCYLPPHWHGSCTTAW